MMRLMVRGILHQVLVSNDAMKCQVHVAKIGILMDRSSKFIMHGVSIGKLMLQVACAELANDACGLRRLADLYHVLMSHLCLLTEVMKRETSCISHRR